MVRTSTIVAALAMAGESTGATAGGEVTSAGRWPANLILTDPIFDGGVEGVVGGGTVQSSPFPPHNGEPQVTPFSAGTHPGYGDSGTYSRFFLIPKAARSDREPLVRGGLEERVIDTQGKAEGWTRDENGGHSTGDNRKARANSHPTVKPLDLMRHLVRLVTPPGGTVLDCFLGSGTTAIAANQEGFRCIGIEREREYLDIALARMTHQPLGMQL